MTDTLPRLELGEHNSPFDEAVIVIEGREEDTIRIECEGALELADRLIRYVNAHENIVAALTAAAACLRHFDHPAQQYDARSLATHCDTIIDQIGAAA